MYVKVRGHSKSTRTEQDFFLYMTDFFNFQSHTRSIIKTANIKLSALIRFALLMTDFNKKVMSNSFVKGNFNYCPLLWMFSCKS